MTSKIEIVPARSLRPTTQQALATVQAIAKAQQDGLTAKATAQRLTDVGITTTTGLPYTAAGVQRIVQQLRYPARYPGSFAKAVAAVPA